MPDHWSAQTELPQGPNHCPVSSGSMGDRLPGRLLRCYSLESPSTRRSLSRGVPSPVISTATCRVRFHLLLPDPNPVAYASLDVDDRKSSGPETVTVSHDPSTGLFVAGDYRYWVHNFSIPPEFNVECSRGRVPMQCPARTVLGQQRDGKPGPRCLACLQLHPDVGRRHNDHAAPSLRGRKLRYRLPVRGRGRRTAPAARQWARQGHGILRQVSDSEQGPDRAGRGPWFRDSQATHDSRCVSQNEDAVWREDSSLLVCPVCVRPVDRHSMWSGAAPRKAIHGERPPGRLLRLPMPPSTAFYHQLATGQSVKLVDHRER